MNVETLLQRLASRARLGDVPRVNVAERVMAQLAASRRLEAAAASEMAASDRALTWGVAACVSLAVLTALAAYAFWQGCQDPVLASLLELSWGLPI
jgi:hypothetical protein